MHDKSIIHKNLKLTNIFLTGKNEVKLSDIGVDEMIRCNENSTFFSRYAYLAPESRKEGVYSTESDVWSIGVIFYYLLVGELPFNEENIKKDKFEVHIDPN